MCLYEPPLLLGMPDLSAALICSLPLAASAANWRELIAAWVGLTVAFLGAHFFIVAMVYDAPPQTFYWIKEQRRELPASFVTVAFDLAIFYAAAQSVRHLSRGDYRRALLWSTPVLIVVATVAGIVAYVASLTHASDLQQPVLLGMNVSLPETNVSTEEIVPVGCVIPPFGDEVPGYTMLAALVLFEILVATGIANAINRMRPQHMSKR